MMCLHRLSYSTRLEQLVVDKLKGNVRLEKLGSYL